jgi:hypothetical protein
VDPRVDPRAWFETARGGETAGGGAGVPAWAGYAGKAIINYRRKKDDDAEFRSSLSGTRADAMISRVRAAHAVVIIYGTRTASPSGVHPIRGRHRFAHNSRVLLFQAFFLSVFYYYFVDRGSLAQS